MRERERRIESWGRQTKSASRSLRERSVSHCLNVAGSNAATVSEPTQLFNSLNIRCEHFCTLALRPAKAVRARVCFECSARPVEVDVLPFDWRCKVDFSSQRDNRVAR